MVDRLFTFQTRIGDFPALDAFADHFGHIERCLFARTRDGRSAASFKNTFLQEFGITARQFNAIRIGLEGKVDSIKARRPESIAEGELRMGKVVRTIDKIEAQLAVLRDPQAAFKKGRLVRTLTPEERQLAIGKARFKLHQKKRMLAMRRARLAALKADQAVGHVRLCFGSKRRFRAQFSLASNGFASLDAWRKEWHAARTNQFSVIGSQDETAGNQSCQAHVREDGTFTLKLRLPDALKEHDKVLSIPGVKFAYGHERIVAALNTSQRVPAKTKAGEVTVKRIGTALTYRFVQDKTGWRVFVSVAVPPIKIETQALLGAIGVDTNADHLAIAETDRFGNLIRAMRFDLPLYGKATQQAKAMIGDACVSLASLAKAAGKPVVIETLDFTRKKAELGGVAPRQARMLSSFTSNKIASGIDAACFRAGVEVIKINPVYTSVIGAVNHAQVKGISIHMGAAFAIARRGLGLSEQPAVRTVHAPNRSGGHVTFALPVRNRAKHVWTQWSAIRTRLKAAHVAHYRSDAANAPPAPLRPSNPASCATRSSTVRSRGANRQEHCSPDVQADVPW